MSHELGHNLGNQHDTEWCVCASQWCIMAPTVQGTTKFSNCSYAYYWDHTMSKGMCIYPPPYPGNVFRLQYCGNLVVEEREECDCGSTKQCEHHPCCLLNCTLRPGAACAFGLCCKDCKFMPSGTLCRQQMDECDLPEWCHGTFHQCPEDVYVQDGIPCSDGAYCYQKRCSGHDKQCREIFGEGAKSASQNCCKEINSQGNRFGHCGLTGTAYLKCNTADILCGRVQCENMSVIPNLVEHAIGLQGQFNDTTCWGIDYHLGMSIPDIGRVKDGTVCGPEKMGIYQKCVSMVHLPQHCRCETCHMNGVCNNKQHCHCNRGWAPPNCTHKGNGGSDDSGPPPKNQGPEAKLAYVSLLCLGPLFAFFLYRFLVLCKKHKRKNREEVKEEEEIKEEEKEQ